MDGMDGSLGLVEYRAPYGANKEKTYRRGKRALQPLRQFANFLMPSSATNARNAREGGEHFDRRGDRIWRELSDEPYDPDASLCLSLL